MKFSSLKTKIITLLTITSLSIAFILLYIFINFYKKDKMAYIFETNTNLLVAVSEEFKREIDFSSEIVKTHLENIKQFKKLSSSTSPVLKNDYFLNSVTFYSYKDDLKLIDQIKKENAQFLEADFIKQKMGSEFGKQIKLDDFNKNEQNKQGNNSTQNEKLSSVAETQQSILIDKNIITVLSKVTKDNQSWILAYQFNSKTMSEYFEKAESQNVLMTYKSDQIINFSYPTIEKNKTALINSNILKTLKANMGQNISTTLLKIENENYLFSAVKLYQSQNFLSVFISESKAMENLRLLLIKAIFFFILIASVVIFISYFSSDYLTHRLKKLTQSAERIANGQFDQKIIDSGNDEISTLTNGFNQMSSEISRLLHETANKARMESELKTAQIVQATLFPKNDYESNSIIIKGCYTSASECGGDWWHYFESEDKIWLWIADATGHGAPAALLTSAAKSAVSIIENLNLSIEDSFQHLNYAICNVSKENMMMTSFVAMIDKKTLEMKYINASHEPSILIKKNTEVSKHDFIYLNEATNPRLGQSKESHFQSCNIQLNPGDRVVFYTDGVTDIRSPQDKVYGERSFVKGLVSSYNISKSLNEFFNDYDQSLNDFRKNTELIDDVTYFFFEMK